MVNSVTGEWKYSPDIPEKDKCDLDIAADIIVKEFNYEPKEISLELFLLRMIVAEECETLNIYDDKTHMLDPVKFRNFVYDSRPLSNFDYKA